MTGDLVVRPAPRQGVTCRPASRRSSTTHSEPFPVQRVLLGNNRRSTVMTWGRATDHQIRSAGGYRPRRSGNRRAVQRAAVVPRVDRHLSVARQVSAAISTAARLSCACERGDRPSRTSLIRSSSRRYSVTTPGLRIRVGIWIEALLPRAVHVIPVDPGSNRSNAGSGSSPTNSSAEASTLHSMPWKKDIHQLIGPATQPQPSSRSRQPMTLSCPSPTISPRSNQPGKNQTEET